MDAFINVITKDSKVRVKINNILDRYNRLPLKCQSKIRYDTLIQNITLKVIIEIMGTVITDLAIELKPQFSRIKDLENKNLYNCKFTLVRKLI